MIWRRFLRLHPEYRQAGRFLKGPVYHLRPMDSAVLQTLQARARGLLVLHGILETPPVRQLVGVIDALAAGDGAAAQTAYAGLFRALLAAPGGLLGGLADAVLYDENALARASAGSALLEAARADLRTLQTLLGVAPALAGQVASLTGVEAPALPAAEGLARGGDVGDWTKRLGASEDWGDLAPALAAHYRDHGAGPLARHRAFRWTGAALEPVLDPDLPAPSSLVGYEAERALLRKTTAQFVAGYPANSVLLYGDRGTGKSSSVKSLLHPESATGAPVTAWDRLRLIEVPKGRLSDFPAIVSRLRGRPQRFILFVDDLSFEEGETEYKDMKALLEGGIEARPANVVVYATSNRRHLIRERFADRAAPDSDEVHARDTVEEKLSFSDRFGITITFPSPSQAAYLEIVEGLARQRKLKMEPAALRARAIEWAAWHNGRSGRTARQFIDYLEGELGLAAPRTAAP